MITRHQIMHDVEAFLARTGMHQTTFGMRSVGDFKLVTRLRNGKDIMLSRLEKMYRFMAAYDASEKAKKKPRATSRVAA